MTSLYVLGTSKLDVEVRLLIIFFKKSWKYVSLVAKGLLMVMSRVLFITFQFIQA